MAAFKGKKLKVGDKIPLLPTQAASVRQFMDEVKALQGTIEFLSESIYRQKMMFWERFKEDHKLPDNMVFRVSIRSSKRGAEVTVEGLDES